MSEISYAVDGQIAVIRINRPERRNALTPDAIQALLEAVVEDERIRPGFDGLSRASEAIRPDPAWRDFGEQERFVADHSRGMGVGVD